MPLSVQTHLWGSNLAAPTRQLSRPSFEVGETDIQEGDAFALVKRLAPRSIDLIITSPPYWGQRAYSGEHNWTILREWARETDNPDTPPPYEWYVGHGGLFGLEPLPHWYITYLAEFFDLARPALKEHGSIWINIGDTYFTRWASIREKGRQGLGNNPRERRRVPMGGYRQEKQLLLIPARFAIAMQDRRWILRNDLIWHKPNVPPRPERDRLRLAHEHFFHFVHKPKEGRAKYFYDLSETERMQNDVVTVNVKPGQDGHTATFPESLIAPRIRSSSPEGGTILDPFAGTGRSLVVAAQAGRNAIGFELSPEFAVAARRAVAALKVI